MAARIQITDLRERIKETRREFEAAKQRTDQLGAELRAYELVLDAEQRKQVGAIQAEQLAASERKTGINRIQFIRKFIQTQRPQGVRASDVIEASKRGGVHIPSDYVYTALFRLRKSGEIEERDRRYFPIEKGPDLINKKSGATKK